VHYSLELSKTADKKLRKLCGKNKAFFEAVDGKIQQILENPLHFKPLRAPMQNKRRAHVGSFVLVFEIEEARKTIVVLDCEHHDKVYK
jgi:mRNA-degrading endonuclease RelE of RelBE toxin-antitoxin system